MSDHDMLWEKYVRMMTKHKLMLRMLEFCKEDHDELHAEDYLIIEACADAIYKILCVLKSKLAR